MQSPVVSEHFSVDEHIYIFGVHVPLRGSSIVDVNIQVQFKHLLLRIYASSLWNVSCRYG